MEFLIEVVGGLIGEAVLELGLRALYRLPRLARGFRSESVQTVFALHSLD